MADNLGVADEDVRIFKEWVEKQPHLPYEDDFTIRCFIRASKHSVQEAKIRYDNYYNFACKWTHLVEDWDLLSERQLTTAKAIHMGFTESDDTAYTFTKIVDPDASKVDQYQFFMRLVSINIIRMWEHNTKEYLVTVMDFGSSSISHALLFSPSFLEEIARTLGKGHLPLKIKKIILTSMPPFMEYSAKIFSQFLSKKLQSRIFFANDRSVLLKEVPLEYLPKDYGGQQKALQDLNEDLLEKARQYRQKYLDQRSLRVAEEKLRTKDPHSNDLPGTFRKLAVD